MINLLQVLLRYYDVDIMDSLSYFTHETNDSVDSYIGRGNSAIDSDNSGSNGSNTSNRGNTSNSGGSSQEDQESLSKESKETLSNDSDDYREIPIIFVPGNDGSNRGDSDNGSDSDNGGSSENRCNSRENGLGKSKKDYLYIRTDISFLFKFISKYTIQHIDQTINNIIPTILTDYTQNIGTYINTALASITSLGVNITSFTDSISFCVKSNSSICQYIGCAIFGIGCAILITIKTGFLIQVQYSIEKLRVQYEIVKLTVEYFIDKLRFEYALGKLPDLIIQYTKMLLEGPTPEIHLKNLEIMYSVPTFTINNLAGISNLNNSYIAPYALSIWYSRVKKVIWNEKNTSLNSHKNKNRHLAFNSVDSSNHH